MRVSTNQIYDAGALGIQQNHSALFKLNNQLSTGRRVLTPQDDPVAAAQALVVTQSKEVNQQYLNNQGQAKHQMALVDSHMSSIVNLLNNVRERVIQAGNATLTQSDRAAIAAEVEERLSELVGIANSDNGVGEYLFSGFSGNVKPFAVNNADAAIPPATERPFAYFGDSGERLQQVSSSRQMAVSVSGNDLFMAPKQGNGTFVAAPGGNVGVSVGVRDTASTAVADAGTIQNRAQWDAAQKNPAAGRPLEIRFEDDGLGNLAYRIHDPVGGLIPAAANPAIPYDPATGASIPLITAGGVNFGAQVRITGTPVSGDSFRIQPGVNQGSALPDLGSVRDPQKWASAINNAAAGKPLEIRFSSDTDGKLQFSLYDSVGGATSPQPYAPGQAIPLITQGGVDFGSQIIVNGDPKPGDSFTVKASESQSMFQTLQNLLGVLKNPVGEASYTRTQYMGDLNAELANLDQALGNVSRIQSNFGVQQQELESLKSTLSDLDIQYQSNLSELQDLDYNKAISDFIKQQINLEAAQKSFAQISGLSLFKYL